MDRNLNIKYYSYPERNFYSISLTEDGNILASSAGVHESTTLHMFVTLCANALNYTKGEMSIGDKMEVLKRFANEILFVRKY